MIFYVTCKLLSHSLIVNLLNKEIYGINFDVELKCRYLLTLHHRLNLKTNLNSSLLLVKRHLILMKIVMFSIQTLKILRVILSKIE